MPTPLPALNTRRTEAIARRRSLAIAAVAVAAVTFGFRFLTFRGLSNDHYMYLGFAQQLLFGELPGRDFVDPGFPLHYTVSAFFQWVLPGPFTDAMVSIAVLAMSGAAVTLVAGLVTRSSFAGVSAGLMAAACVPRLYNYPRVFVPAVTLLLVYHLGRQPRTAGILTLAAWTIVAALLRHDLGAFVLAATVAALLAVAGDPIRGRLHHTGRYALAVAAMSLPYLLFVAGSEGVMEHLRIGAEFARLDAHQLMLAPSQWPLFERLDPADWLRNESAVLMFWLVHVLLLAAGALAVRALRRRSESAGVLMAAFVLLLCYRIIILRHPLAARLPDLASIVAFCGIVSAVGAMRTVRGHLATRPVASLLLATTALACMSAAALAMSTTIGLPEELNHAGLAQGARGVYSRARTVIQRGLDRSWDPYWPAGAVPPAIPYLAACTGPADRLLTTWPSPEHHVFARRPFAAGHVQLFHRSAFAGLRDQQSAVDRLRHQHVPVVLIDERTYHDFRGWFPLIADYIDTNYVTAGEYTVRDGSTVAIAVHRGLRAEGAYGKQHWPCGLVWDRRAPEPTERSSADRSHSGS